MTDHVLVSHRDWGPITGHQKALTNDLAELWGAPPRSVTATVGRTATQLGSHAAFGHEPSSRSRSLLFIAIGLCAAGAAGSTLLIPENGFASLNPPMGGERRGALSTRTTHPHYLRRLGTLLQAVGAHDDFVNPCASLTKAQMFSGVTSQIGAANASKLLSRSHSCARGDNRFAGLAGGYDHCGVCFGCIVRRAAFLGSGLTDATRYVIDDLTTSVGAHDGWYSEKRARDLQAARYAAHRGLNEAELLASLPPGHDPDAAIDVATRGLREIAELVL